MKFSDLKDCVPFPTVLVDKHGAERYFIAINPYTNRLTTSRVDDGADCSWSETEIENWTIKQPGKEKPELPEEVSERNISDPIDNRKAINELIRWAKWAEEKIGE